VVVVTGMGVVSAAGVGAAALSEALAAHRFCGSPAGSALPVQQVARVPVPVPVHPDFPDDRKAALAFLALDEALHDAGLTGPAAPWPHPASRSVFLGTGLSSVTPDELEQDLFPFLVDGRFDRDAMARDVDPSRPAPRRHLPGRVTAAVAARVGAEGPCGTSFSACAAAAMAIGDGLDAIRSGRASVAIVGGHDAMIHPLGMLSFVVLGALSPTACRPFDLGRDGFMIGEGAAFFVLESAERAAARGARARAVLCGAGTSADAWNATAPHPEGAGAEAAMRRALADAGLHPADIGYLNAHGTGTPLGDAAEVAAARRVFGDALPISSIKGAVGHTIAAAGAVEAAACILAMEGGFLPGTVGLATRDPSLPGALLTGPVAARPRHVISNSFGFGGQNASLVFGRPPGALA
jgi:3-oxoacyl-[acyl-carrier-protein] synthase II